MSSELPETPTRRTFAWCDMVREQGAALAALISASALCAVCAALFTFILIGASQSRGDYGYQCVLFFSIPMTGSVVYTVFMALRVRARGRTVRAGTELPEALEDLRELRWPLVRCSGAHGQPACRVRACADVRATVDSTLAMGVEAIERPRGLIEPAICLPGASWRGVVSWLQLVIVAPLALLLGLSMLVNAGGSTGWTQIVLILLGLILLWAGLGPCLSIPAIQRLLHDVPVLGRLGRGGLTRRRMVAGPGFVRYGRLIWSADEDLMLVRRHRLTRSASNVEVMVAGRAGRVRITCPGLTDQAFVRLWQAWHCPEIRPELARSDLA